ncbi:MAG TPA: VOC family protein [Vicinamibacterales bacterium]|nr:VOC family protein [Vicinamibacterales bacterium]
MTTTASALSHKSLLPGFTVNDVSRSIAFYEALGFTVSDRWEENGTLTGVMMRSGALELGLSQDDWKKGRDRQKGIGTRLNIETSQNIDELAGRMKAAGFTLDVEPFDTPWKTRQFELTDPSGFKITVTSEWPRT